jgi:hypothetical protein
MKTSRFAWLIPMVALLAPPVTMSADVSRYLYRETTGTESVELIHRIEIGDNAVITCTQAGEERRTVSDFSGTTREWRISKGSNTEIVARRRNGAIVVSGTRDGTPVAETLSNKDLPWFQLLSFSLGAFRDSDETSVTFQMLRPDTLSIVTLEAKKQGEETIVVAGNPTTASKIRISPPWPLSALWKGYYWFRKKDGLFVRYEGTNGPPGTAKTVVEFLRVLHPDR